MRIKKSIFKRTLMFAITVMLISAFMVGCMPCNKRPPLQISARDLMMDITSQEVTASNLNNEFIEAKANFSFNLFRETLQNDENTLISATSVLLALAMTANGARDKTLSQMEEVLGGGMPIAQLNRYLHSFANELFSGEKSELDIANSIWFRDHMLQVNPEFLQANADYFGASAYAAPFDKTTVDDINAWVSYHTDGMIDKIVEEISQEAMMYLVNAIMFDAEWARLYDATDIGSGTFTAFDGRKQLATFMTSGGWTPERYFIEDDLATGFIKPYHGGHYSFVALLPNEGVSIFDYAASLTGTGFLDTIQGVQNLSVVARLPKFEFDFDLNLNESLQSLGMKDAFCEKIANLRGIGHTLYGDLWISKVQHNTFISVNERGTRAGAVTSVGVSGPTSIPQFDRYVILDHPFVFAIIDNKTSLPIFIGKLLEV